MTARKIAVASRRSGKQAALVAAAVERIVARSAQSLLETGHAALARGDDPAAAITRELWCCLMGTLGVEGDEVLPHEIWRRLEAGTYGGGCGHVPRPGVCGGCKLTRQGL